MIDARHQGHGYGRRAVELLVEEARGDGVEKVTLSVVPGDGSALEFYKRLGFVETGNVHGKEIELALSPLRLGADAATSASTLSPW